MRRIRLNFMPACIILGLVVSSVFAQPQARYIPAPLRVSVSVQSSWDTMLEVLRAREFPLEVEDKALGKILTESREYSSGPLTESHIAKVGDKPKLVDGEWAKVEYQYEVEVTLLGDRETLVTVAANIRALKRDFLGTSQWVPIPSNGRLEEELLTGFGQRLFGQTFALDRPRKGFWERAPGYAPSGEIAPPEIVGPERRPPPSK